jgi:CBS domain-containing protein
MTTVAQILKSKPDQSVATIEPDAAVFEAGKIAGIITERDYARKVALRARSSQDTPVREVMTAQVMTVRPDQTNEECMALMTEHRVRHLPVMDGGRMIGVVSIGDLVKDIISEQKEIIQQLEHYIAGNIA